MEIEAKKFWLPKQGSTKTEYEDACSFARDAGRFAIADGATEASFSGTWARLLVRAFRQGKLSVPLTLDELKPLQSRWQKAVGGRQLPWYAEEKLSYGAFAAFAGLELLEKRSGGGNERIWRATAAGDSCVVQVRGDEILKAFPLSDAASFNNRPNLLCSVPAFNEDENGLVSNAAGAWGRGDLFFLMTDALACWFFQEAEQGRRPWRVLRELETKGQPSFEQCLLGLRAGGQIKNDDVTLLRVEVFA